MYTCGLIEFSCGLRNTHRRSNKIETQKSVSRRLEKKFKRQQKKNEIVAFDFENGILGVYRSILEVGIKKCSQLSQVAEQPRQTNQMMMMIWRLFFFLCFHLDLQAMKRSR